MSKESLYSLPKPGKHSPLAWTKSLYGLAAGLMLLGCVVMGVAGGSAFSAISKGGHQISFPPGKTLTLKEGIYVGIKDPRQPSKTDGLYISVLDKTTGQSVPVTMTGLGRDEDVAKNPTLFQFQIQFDGPYMLAGTSAVAGGVSHILLMHESVGRAPSDLAVGLIAGGLLILGGIILIIAVRRRVKKILKGAV